MKKREPISIQMNYITGEIAGKIWSNEKRRRLANILLGKKNRAYIEWEEKTQCEKQGERTRK